VGNITANNRSFSKFEAKHWLGKRSEVRGVAMNPVDHSHGGGEGKTPIGRKKPVTPWGYSALGKKSRKRNRYNDASILRRRE
jgi:large subunit ribosomal protein L2